MIGTWIPLNPKNSVQVRETQASGCGKYYLLDYFQLKDMWTRSHLVVLSLKEGRGVVTRNFNTEHLSGEPLRLFEHYCREQDSK